jgi:hypothetical protein
MNRRLGTNGKADRVPATSQDMERAPAGDRQSAVDGRQRSLGIGGMVIQDLEAPARDRKRAIIAPGFELRSLHFIKPIGDWKGG